MVSTQWRWTSPPRDGVARLHAASNGRPVEALLANARHGLGGAFLDQEFDEVRHVIDTNVTGTLDLIQRIGRDMRARGRGRILITGSIAGHIPGTYKKPSSILSPSRCARSSKILGSP
jgi:short-subunit dehydrogenase